MDELLANQDPNRRFSTDGLLGQLRKALAERALNAQLNHPLASEVPRGASEAGGASGDALATSVRRNVRNGYSTKHVLTESEKFERAIPRDRDGTFEPPLIAKYQRRFPDFDDKVISMYAIVFFDALRVKIRDEGTVKNKAIYLAVGAELTRCPVH